MFSVNQLINTST